MVAEKLESVPTSYELQNRFAAKLQGNQLERPIEGHLM